MIGMCRRAGLALIRRVASYPSRPGRDVHEDQVGPLLLRHGDPFLPRGGLDQLIAGTGQEEAQDAAVLRVVLDRQEPLAHVLSVWCSTRMGRVKEKVDPCPGVDL